MTETKKAEKPKTRAELLLQIENLVASRSAHWKECNEAHKARDEALARETQTREHFEDLKQRLLAAETETARLRGYLSRVHEDDIVRDGMIEIEDERGKRTVPKRQPPMMAVERDHNFDNSMNRNSRLYGEARKATHWTSY